MQSKYTDELDDCEMICPYCGNKYQPEGEDYSEDCREEECEECGKTYHAHQSFSVTHHATPDCELNGEQHEWQAVSLGAGKGTHDFCATCDKCRPSGS